MAAKVLFVALGSALCLWLWWTVPLKGLRADGSEADRAETSAKQAVIDAQTPLPMTIEEARDILDQYEGMLEWVGDPITRSDKADYMAVCPMMQERLSGIVGEIKGEDYFCQVSPALEAAGNARALPLTLRISTPADNDDLPAEVRSVAEHLVLTLEDDPVMLLNGFTASEDPPDIVDVFGNPVPPKEHINLNVHFYVLAEPPEDVLAAAEAEAAARAEAFESGALVEDLLKRHAQAEQAENEGQR